MIIFGTGHRPEKLGGYSEAAQKKVRDLAYGYLQATRPHKVVSGMAQGWDMALAEASVALGIPFIAAVPFAGFDGRWPLNSRVKLQLLLQRAETIKYVCDPGYAGWKLQRRNVWMVDHAERGVALWDGSSGGTANCLNYASLRGKPVVNLWKDFK